MTNIKTYRFKVTADVLYQCEYIVEAPVKDEAMRIVQEEEVEPDSIRPVTSPIVVYISKQEES